MNKFLLTYIVLLTSCTSLSNFQEQPVVPFGKAKNYKTTCSGLAEDWGSCHRKAKRTCANGYEVEDQNDDKSGVHREMVFSCK
jgi:hypothetical protein